MSNDFPLVSVVIPCFNHGKYIRECVGSALNQSYPNKEVIVVNDGSNDPYTLSVLNELRGFITVLDKQNGHLSSARNHGIKNAKGEYLLVLDSDDYFHPSFLEKAMPIILSDDKIGMVSCWVQYFGDQIHIGKTTAGDTIDFLIKNTFCGNFLLRKSAWEKAGGYDESMKKGLEDWNFTISVLKNSYVLKVIKEPLFYYRKDGESMTSYCEVHRAEIFMQIVRNHQELYRNNFEEVLLRKEQEITRLRLINQKLIVRVQNFENRISDIENSFVFKLSRFKSKIFKLFRINVK